MNRKAYIMLLMYLSWPVNLVHRYWNNRPIEMITPFMFEGQELSVQWYVSGLLNIISWLMIFWGIWLYITGSYRQDRDFRDVFGAYFIILMIDLPHYLLWFKRCEWVLYIELCIMMVSGGLFWWRHYKKGKQWKGN